MQSIAPRPPIWDDTFAARVAADRQSLARRESENFLRDYTRDLFAGRGERFPVDYASPDAYAASRAPLREAWQRSLGIIDLEGRHDDVVQDDFFETDTITARWLTLPISDTFAARAVLALPKQGTPPYQVVIAQHGVSSSPERVFGLDDPRNLYHAYGQRLVEAGYAVLAPQHITEPHPRQRLHRMALMVGSTLWGLEIGKLRVWIDHIATRDDLDANAIAMWGISLGGAYTQFTSAAEERIRVAISTAWFNDRFNKMIIDDPRYSCFLSVDEDHIFIPDWLRDFGDAELVSLICPRPFMAQTGKGDSIAWWPQVQAEFDAAHHHYTKLGIGERAAFDLHDGGHEIRVETGIAFLQRWLGQV